MGTETTTRLQPAGEPSGPGEGMPSVRRGALLGRYTVLVAIGSGGMGNVFAAWDPELHRRVAIKVLHGDLMHSEARQRAQERLRQEAQAAARLAHPNVVAIYDVGTVGERLFLAMELVEGQTLSQWSSQPRPWRETLEIYRQAGRGLAAAHLAGLVHRDFKPGNVMLADDGQVKILDFGLAKGIRGALETSRSDATVGGSASGVDTVTLPQPGIPLATRTGQVMGTPRYMSPEQQLGRPVDHRSDQFSFCISLYQALYGCLPFVTESGEVPQSSPLGGRLRTVPPESEVPSRLHGVLERGLQTEPEARYPSMDELLADLESPATAARRGWIVAAGLLAALVTAVLVLRPQAVQCGAAGDHLEAIWNGARRSSLGQLFSAHGATESWRQVASTVDSKVGALRSMYSEACEATHVRGEQSIDLLDRRMACLDDRRRSTDALLRLFEQGRPEIVSKAAESVGGLPGVAACADRQALADLAPPPPTDALQTAVNGLRQRLADALALELAGRYGEAQPLIQTSLEEATDIAYQPLVGEAHLQLARVTGRLGDSEGMKGHLIDAASIALATHHRELLAEAYLQLIIVGFLHAEIDQALAYGRLAEATISTLSGRQDLEAERLFYLGMIALRRGDFSAAKELYERYLTMQDDLPPRQELTALNNYAEALRELGELALAFQALLEAEQLTDRLAPNHPMRFSILGSLGEVAMVSGDLQQAEDYFQRCLPGLEEAYGPEHPHFANHLVHLGQLYLLDERYGEAVQVLRRVTKIHQETPGYEHKPVARQWMLGRALWHGGQDRQEALSWIRRAAAASDVPGEEAAAAEAAAWLAEHGEAGG